LVNASFRLSRGFARGLEVHKDGRLAQLHSDEKRDAYEKSGDEKWNAPSPGVESRAGHGRLCGQDHQQRDEKSHHGRDLNDAGVEAAAVVGNVFGHVDGCASVFAAESHTLQHANQNQHDGREPAGRGECGQQADGKCRAAHDGERGQKSIFAADKIADAAEKQSAEGSNGEAHGKSGEIGDEREGIVIGRVELQRKNGGKAAEDKKVVPLDHGAERGGDDDQGEGAVLRGGGSAVLCGEIADCALHGYSCSNLRLSRGPRS
jgi:hypothetical protein